MVLFSILYILNKMNLGGIDDIVQGNFLVQMFRKIGFRKRENEQLFVD